MLHEFVTSNRDELIRRCRSKVSKRDSPPVTPTELEHGVPLLEESLMKLRDRVDKSLPEIRLATGMTTPPKARQSA